MKHLLKVTGEVASADYERILLTEDGSVISQLGGGEVEPVEPDYNGYEYVDLGLPSRLKWAKYNVGATSPEETGLYFEWGGIQGYTAEQVGNGEGQKEFENACDYIHYDKQTNDLAKYYMNLDNLDTLLPEDDAAHIIMGGDWRMPTKEDYEELVNNTIFVDITEKYMVLKSKINNMLICFPKTGQAWSGAIKETSSTYVWSNQLYENMPDVCTVLYINEDGNENIPYTTRFAGCVVRGVIK